MRIVLSGGGTGGHIYPALALRKEILKQYPQAEFLYIGTEMGLEGKIVPNLGIDFQTIRVQGLKRSLSFDNVRTLAYMVKSIHQCKKYLKAFQPDVVIGTGGYVCAPVLYQAAKMNIPTIIHEQNSVAGVTNKFLSRYVDKICICYPEVKQDFKHHKNKVVFTGNPRAQELAGDSSQVDLESFQLDNDLPTVLIFGGSRGAQRINEVVLDMVGELQHRSYQSIIATGDIYYEDWQARFPNMENFSNVSILPYINNMPELMRKVDLVVCRSGATTLTELTAVGTPSILIPSPNVTNNHQQHNAESLVNNQAAKMILEKDLSPKRLLQTIDELMTNPGKRIQMSHQAKNLGVPDASDRIIQVIKDLL
ncbi:undecaprenyldiphospho-muramoylpentapeptide beta-N-acetylglucosaminyltransferase [Aerococcus sp. CDC-944-U94]|uniref:undecaprenyldiphospho-muramoylpentapeptide beta-N-acetylglucosaminyltransferase n=1 Tax=Aerococcus urinae (strain CCUG 59500 / ACS-120-V-Col10a) TaxID=2976812 RepID=UPI00227B9A3F|nr:undecaprenyldiphospho-muramoylpentapeptide beta-N-acetylglucosaminyltransferase [Aerococcus sp. Group 1]MCY3055496.1 undecaprenyldiphospho-muramoylpentapeptide beta-N-acetylglucosaminyltransferase [Aerococcus sp. Group 1]MCY3057226.1 undecaprenyldiphospho-muramoylpentapeptide beta-N-acetylglucosaminyltransferase [Aerococcus sp. Group 1]